MSTTASSKQRDYCNIATNYKPTDFKAASVSNKTGVLFQWQHRHSASVHVSPTQRASHVRTLLRVLLAHRPCSAAEASQNSFQVFVSLVKIVALRLAADCRSSAAEPDTLRSSVLSLPSCKFSTQYQRADSILWLVDNAADHRVQNHKEILLSKQVCARISTSAAACLSFIRIDTVQRIESCSG